MDGRELPGFYYDPEKKKYFKIQANHVAPPNSKYSRENAAKEKERSRKRQKTEKYQAKKLTQTVRRSPLLKSWNARTTMGREHGLMRTPHIQQIRAEMFASQLQLVKKINKIKCEDCGSQDFVYDFAVDTAADGIVSAVGHAGKGTMEYTDMSDTRGHQHHFPIASFNSEITSVTVTSCRCAAVTTLCGKFFICKLPRPNSSGWIDWDNFMGGVSATFVPPETSLWSCASNPIGNADLLVAVGSSDSPHAPSRGHASIITASGHLTVSAQHRSPHGLRCADWLDATVCMLGDTRGGITLWDSRTAGTSLRFNTGRAIIGLRGMGNGSELMAAESGALKLFDVRMPTTDTLSIAKQQARKQPVSRASFYMPMPEAKMPNAAFDVLPSARLVARRDDENTVGVYSLISGQRIKTLKTEQSAVIKRLRFLEDNRDTLGLWGCWGSDIATWTFGGEDLTEGEEGEVWIKRA
ncbi:hypothetical protein MBLNU457_3580t1 [Dothideomycetes sp. NU457]